MGTNALWQEQLELVAQRGLGNAYCKLNEELIHARVFTRVFTGKPRRGLQLVFAMPCLQLTLQASACTGFDKFVRIRLSSQCVHPVVAVPCRQSQCRRRYEFSHRGLDANKLFSTRSFEGPNLFVVAARALLRNPAETMPPLPPPLRGMSSKWILKTDFSEVAGSLRLQPLAAADAAACDSDDHYDDPHPPTMSDSLLKSTHLRLGSTLTSQQEVGAHESP